MFKKLGICIAILASGAIGLTVGMNYGRPDDQMVPHLVDVTDNSAIPGAEEATVSETQLQLYIDVYKAMQTDHGLEIEQAIAGRNISLDEFRRLERQIQSKTPLVEKVRTALLEHAKQQAVFALNGPPSPTTAHSAPKKK